MTSYHDELFDADLDQALSVAAPATPPPPELKAAVLAAIDQEPTNLAARRGKKLSGWLTAAASVAILAVGGGLYFMVTHSANETMPSALSDASGMDSSPLSAEEKAHAESDTAFEAAAPTTDIAVADGVLSILPATATEAPMVLLVEAPTTNLQLQLWSLDANNDPSFVGILEEGVQVALPPDSTGLTVTEAVASTEESEPQSAADPVFLSDKVVAEFQF